MNFEAENQKILNLLLGEGKEFKALDRLTRERLNFAIDVIAAVEKVDDLRAFGRFNLKFFNGQYQIYVTPEKRMRFTVDGDTAIIEFFGSTTHKGE